MKSSSVSGEDLVELEDGDLPAVEVRSFDGDRTASVVVTFPWRKQADDFAALVRSMLQTFRRVSEEWDRPVSGHVDFTEGDGGFSLTPETPEDRGDSPSSEESYRREERRKAEGYLKTLDMIRYVLEEAEGSTKARHELMRYADDISRADDRRPAPETEVYDEYGNPVCWLGPSVNGPGFVRVQNVYNEDVVLGFATFAKAVAELYGKGGCR